MFINVLYIYFQHTTSIIDSINKSFKPWLNLFNASIRPIGHMLFLHDTCRVDNCKEQPRNACHILHRQRVRQLHPSRHHVPTATMRQLPIQDCTTTGGRGYQSPKQPHKYGTRQLVCRPGISTKLLPTATSYDTTSQLEILKFILLKNIQSEIQTGEVFCHKFLNF